MCSQPDLIRSIALIGHFHHGKSTFADMLVQQTHYLDLTAEHLVSPLPTQRTDLISP